MTCISLHVIGGLRKVIIILELDFWEGLTHYLIEVTHSWYVVLARLAQNFAYIERHHMYCHTLYHSHTTTHGTETTYQEN